MPKKPVTFKFIVIEGIVYKIAEGRLKAYRESVRKNRNPSIMDYAHKELGPVEPIKAPDPLTRLSQKRRKP